MYFNKEKKIKLTIIIILLIIAFRFIVHKPCNEFNKKLEIIAGQSIDFENAEIRGKEVITNGQHLLIHKSANISENSSVRIDNKNNKSILIKLAPKEGRNELMVADIPNNTKKYIGFSVLFPTEYKIPKDWNLFAQWWQGAPASPPIAFEITPNTESFEMRILTRYGHYQDKNVDVQYNDFIQKGEWIDFIIEMRIDDSGEDNGILNVWKNGEHIVNYKGPLGYTNMNDKTNFRVGLYRYPFINTSVSTYYDNIIIGDQIKR